MSIKPIDFQVILPKTAEVSKMNNDEQHKTQLVQQQQAQMVQHKSEGNTRQVYAQDKTHEALIKEKQEKNGRNGQKENKNSNQKKKKDDARPASKTSTIDIRL